MISIAILQPVSVGDTRVVYGCVKWWFKAIGPSMMVYDTFRLVRLVKKFFIA